ncbi:beta-lactamase/transpeptidase-like protein [Cryphonectria parasitica EP155]|uniref:Beta-lactamase/transpeptidase-like protein n=1 Tax=Cryphonectria parasitica (strain ATCC 38755 / EP155) TaxID=660469 RepID=A0A9P5CPT8_CRYP1|nr:beta-lactamase/transpeptidase-like protein [Cryphonectria parasitica EP155]KAF3765767.1 beta-lactamase/transpeptidase-like protein [Cryphonectria parasitica EP155]
MEKLDCILESHVAKGSETPGKDKLLGAAFVVVNKDGVIYEGSAGRNLSSADSPPFTPDSFCWVASMTKLATAACAMRLVERGLVGLDDDVRPLVPQLAEVKILRGFVGNDVPFLEENSTPITMRQLLLHTAGFAYGNGDPDLARWAKHIGRRHDDLQGTVEIWNTPLKFTPGQGWCYGSSIDWAGQVMERLTGKRLDECMAEEIFRPLGMNDTTFRRALLLPRIEGRSVPTANRNKASGELTTGAHFMPADPEVDSGGGGLHTTAADYAKLLQALLKASSSSSSSSSSSLAGPDDSGLLLMKKETVDEMFRPQLTDKERRWLEFITGRFHDGMTPDFEPGTPLDHGLSGVINMADSAGKRRKGSMMWAGMCNAHWFIDRESGIGATLMTNVLPQPDPVVVRVWDELERALYSALPVHSLFYWAK